MALIVEDGTGLPTANAYISVEFADTYHSDFCQPEWGGVVSAKEAAIRKATDYVDRHFDFLGDRVVIGDGVNSIPPQALSWPREGVIHPEGYVVDPAAVPVEVQRATAELALVILTTDLEPTVEGGFVRSTTEQVGRVSTQLNYAGSSGAPEVPIVHSILRPLLSASGGFGTARILRA